MTEQQVYEVVRTEAAFELRLYPQHVVAEMEVDSTFESAGSSAFRPLVGYIGGGNESGTGMSMTAPVIQRQDETAVLDQPMTTTDISPGRYVVSFVLPADTDASTVPAPKDERVRVRVVEEEYAAAVRFSGRWTAASYTQRVDSLRAAIAEAGLEPTGPVRFARFDPPWTPWFLRRNEVVIPVRLP